MFIARTNLIKFVTGTSEGRDAAPRRPRAASAESERPLDAGGTARRAVPTSEIISLVAPGGWAASA